MSSVRWGMIGCGSVTELKSGPAFYKAPGSALVAVMGRREEAVRDYASRHGIARYYTDAQALINDPEVDAVYIATPPDSHLEYSLMVAAAGKHCCVEKPMALNAEQSALMQRTFERAGLHLFVSYYRRSLPRFQQVRAWLQDGRIGTLRQLTWTLCKPPAAEDASAANWRTDPSIAGGGYFADLASHGFDLFQYLAGDIVEVAGFTARQAGHYAAEDAVTACWTFSSGALGMGCWNFVADRREDRVELIGSRGRIQFSVFEDQPLHLEGETNEVLEVPCHPHIQWHHVVAMNAHIRGEAEHPSLAIEALKTDRILDKVLQRNPNLPG
ncbi:MULTISPECIES: Gfo/Idh/MocA family protein [Pseudomonas]|uniref:Gfo/Idh/MocA family protein n=1 Tax=Pseudomonas TaxID=286 RepID=UPI0004880FF7|nr:MULTISPECIES: Gfo/Idh/MocA family oxidoreductase [Pseudomonas]HAA40275.1 gfo/Idh/MocA family oxidoreductase [Pseudomonas sp.]KAA8551124.1 Myo-inositol 2-dehydrogenase [Pseudomonas marginalis]TWR66354.1 Gfo/Idh/MocA family oxidoreductase [Pseudomonas marginalis]SCX28737.1 Predicted dehydrogenase [Pseudomonas sp. NFACC25]SMF59943.1 Predicted dehydrogenase [Pseudomonas sp. LAMO17WK12:I1]